MQMTIIGCGNMGSALAQRLGSHYKLIFYDHNAAKAEALQAQGLGKVSKNLAKDLEQSDIIFLAIKPQNLNEAAAQFPSKRGTKGPLLVSLLSGTSLDSLKEHFPNFRSMRMMPNLAMIYGEGLIAFVEDGKLTSKERDQITKLGEFLGKVHWLPESKIDAFTALAGSGPAFAFIIFEAMVDAGLALGFNVKESQQLVQQMLKGSLHLLEKSGKHPGELKWQVTSPAGTTIAGIKCLEEHAVRAGVIDTFVATYERAKKLHEM